MRFKDCVIVITSGAQRFGEALARRFASEGAKVVITNLQGKKCESLAAHLKQAFGVETLALSVSDHDRVQAAVAKIVRTLGTIDIWVNNAGVYRGTPLERVSMNEWQMMLDVSYTGVFVCTKASAPVMKTQQRGRIINMSSSAGRAGFRNSLAYCSNKATVIGLNRLNRATATDLASFGVTVNAVCPGSILTDMLRKVDDDICSHEGSPVGTHLRDKAQAIPVAWLGTPEDVVGVVTFLASADAESVTGQVIEVDGGEIVV